MADGGSESEIYRECVTMHYWGGVGNGVGLLAKVDFYDSQTFIRWLPQSKENNPAAVTPETLKLLTAAIDEDRRRIGFMLTPNLNDEVDNEGGV